MPAEAVLHSSDTSNAFMNGIGETELLCCFFPPVKMSRRLMCVELS